MKRNQTLIFLTIIVALLLSGSLRINTTYQSGWVLLVPGEVSDFAHQLGRLPSSVFIWCAVPVDVENGFTYAAPWTDTHICNVTFIASPDVIQVTNSGEAIYVMVTAKQ